MTLSLKHPFCISPRLLPAVQVGTGADSAWISLEALRVDGEGRTVFRYYLDTPAGEFSGEDLRSGCGNGGGAKGLQAAFANLLSFLGAFAESRACRGEGDNSDLFPAPLSDWAIANRDGIALLQCEIEESEEPLITEP